MEMMASHTVALTTLKQIGLSFHFTWTTTKTFFLPEPRNSNSPVIEDWLYWNGLIPELLIPARRTSQ